jgi:HEAT repeat protein
MARFAPYLLVPLFLFGQGDPRTHALFLMRQGRLEEAIDQYRHSPKHDFETLQQMGLTLFEQGISTDQPEIFLMTLYGAGLSGSSIALEILEKGLQIPDPQIQLISIHFISEFQDDKADRLLIDAMSSDFLSTRMEAAYALASKRHPKASGLIEGLMTRLPPAFKPYFPALFALIGTQEATSALRRLIDDPDASVRIEAILHTANLGRDDLLPLIRKRLIHTQIAEGEAAASAIGKLKDSSSHSKLIRLLDSPGDNVRIAAALSLLQLGDRSGVPLLEELAMAKNLFAISALAQVAESASVLSQLAKSTDLQVRLNAGLALLTLRDSRCLPTLLEVLLPDARDLAFYPFPSLGRTHVSWRAVPSAELKNKDPTVDLSLTHSIREHFLRESLQLPEEDFLDLARYLFDHPYSPLIPTLIHLLENLRTDGAISLLKEGTHRMGTPLIRDYSHLALFRLSIPGPHEEYVSAWVMRQKHDELIRLRPMLPWKMRLEGDNSLTPEERSQLLIESFLTIAQAQSEKSVDLLLEAIKSGHPANRYALFGLLLRATE